MKKYFVCLLFFISVIGKEVKSQAIADTTFNNIVSRIAEVYWTSSYVQFKVSYRYQEVDSATSVTDTMTMNYQVNKDNFLISGGGVESMQNANYKVTVYTQDSTMQVEKPMSINYQLFRVNIDENNFRQQYVTGFSKADSSGFQKISILFKTDAPYTNYDITYDTATYRILSLTYRMKKGNYLTPPSESMMMSIPEGFIVVQMNFSAFATNAFTDSVFDQAKYFTALNGAFVPVSPYLNFELINSIVE